jgi:hypothetical protein
VPVLALFAATVFLLASTPPAVRAQATGVPIEPPRQASRDKELIQQAELLRNDGKLLSAKFVADQLKTPQPGPIKLPKARTKTLRGRDVAARARQGAVRVGWFYLCMRCKNWHLDLSDGYAIADDAIVTCHHCVEPDSAMREGYLIAVDPAGTVLPVTAVLAKSKSMDAAILRVSGGRFTPLPLNDEVAPGDAAFCLSDPLGQSGYLSVGIVNRFYWLPSRSGEPGSLDEMKALRLNVSTDWAPGSSGAAVLDDFGNVIGHVSTIAPLSETAARAPALQPSEETPKTSDEKDPENVGEEKKTPAPRRPGPRGRFNGAVLITLHEAVPARSVLALVKSAPVAAATPASKKPGTGRRR